MEVIELDSIVLDRFYCRGKIEVGHKITSLQSIQSTHVLNCGWGNKNHTWVTGGQQQHLATTKDTEINTKLWRFYKNISTLLQLRLAFLENERPYLRLWVGVDNWDVSLERWLTFPSTEKMCTVLIDSLGYSWGRGEERWWHDHGLVDGFERISN